MAKWFGKIGYSLTVEKEPGLWVPDIIEKSYFGEITSDHRKRQSLESSTNDTINLSNIISIIADPFVIENCSNICYVEIMNNKWKVNDIEIKYPRLILSIGGVYNG